MGRKQLPGNSTFYIFVDVSDAGIDTLDFCLYLLFKHGIAVVPGEAYGKSTNQFVRIGIGAESEERIIEALNIMDVVIKNHQADVGYVDKKLEKGDYYRFGKKE